MRALKIFKRYGLAKKQMQDYLLKYIKIMHNHNCVPTLPITACIVERYPTLIKRFLNEGVDFAIHGYIHIDYTKLSAKILNEHLEKAIKIFRSLCIPFYGFRCPYLKLTEEILENMSCFDFLWDSSQAVNWDLLKREDFSSEKWKNYQKMIAQYKPYNAQNRKILPKLKYNLVEIPVSLPDDDLLIDRLGITNQKIIENIWSKILERTYHRGELFTLQLHPERIKFCEKALESILMQAKKLNPGIWIASLSEIAKWWKEKKEFSFEIIDQGPNRYQIIARCSKRATILLKNSESNCSRKNFFDGYRITDGNMFFIESPAKPIVGIPVNSPIELIDFLKEEGIPFEFNNDKNKYGVYLGNYSSFSDRNRREVFNAINQASSALVRFWRWPHYARSALAVTGDIDALTSIDFFLRFLKG